ncbi:MAG TPA: hypothetical protein VG326_03320 [Tepidisphaeraceae bacterium]|jgi:hypothetical protein|nr:hypothetical protein [Tepidisphaeraceae bacterium]
MTRQRVSLWVSLLAATAALGVGCQANKPAVATNADATEGVAIPAAAINRGPVLTDLIGGDLGIGGGYLIAAAPEKIQRRQHQQAIAAAHKAEESPVTVQQVHESENADLNGDGFITLDEILAMARSGLSDREIADRLQKTHFIFRVTPQQERYLTDRGVSQNVIGALHALSGEGGAQASL